MKVDMKQENGTVVSINEQFTQVETTTGSGKKITIPHLMKKFAPSSGLGNNQISSLLDSDSDFEIYHPKPKKSGKAKKSLRNQNKQSDTSPKLATPVKRTRRASVSCSTPTTKIAKT